MQVDRNRFMQDGYVMLKEVIPPDELNAMRAAFGAMFDKQKAISDDAWAHSSQRRVVLPAVVDRTTARVVEFCLHDNVLGVSRELMGASDAAPTIMNSLCDPARDVGPAAWHRDIRNADLVLLPGIQADMLANDASDHVQWNIPLYDDSVLWVIPGSHRRPNTEVEDRQILANPNVPLPGGVQVDLRAGDAVAYNALMLHWGSNYSTNLRQTIHLAYRPFGGPIFPFQGYPAWNLDFVHHLSPTARASFERAAELFAQERTVIAHLFRAMIERDAPGFEAALDRLHPGAAGRMVAVTLLIGIARQLQMLTAPEVAGLPDQERASAIGVRPSGLAYWDTLAAQFSPSEAETLWGRFAPLDARLREPARTAGTDSRGVAASQGALQPAGLDVAEFVASWA